MHYEDEQVEIHKLVVGPIDNNVFVVRCRQTGDALLVDAANEHEQLLELCQRARRAQDRRDPRPLGPHPGRPPAARGRLRGGGPGRGRRHAPLLRPAAGGRRRCSRSAGCGCARSTRPGTRPARCAFSSRAHRCCSPGDTLFPGRSRATPPPSSGTSPPSSSSIERRLFAPLAPETIVMPGHGLDTTIGNERPHLDEWVARGW